MLKFLIPALCLFFLAFSSLGQDDKSLKPELDLGQSPEIQVDSLNKSAFNKISVDPRAAKAEVLEAYNQAVDFNYRSGEARSLVVMGGILWSVADYEDALSHYLEALKIYESEQDMLNQSVCLNNIGEVYKKLEDYNQALSYLSKALELKTKVLNGNATSLSYSNIAEVYLSLKDYVKAKEFYDEAYALGLKEDNKHHMAYVYEGLGALNTYQKNYGTGINNYLKAVALRKSILDNRGLATAYLNLGAAYAELKILDSASYYFTVAEKLVDDTDFFDIKMKLYKSKAKLDSVNQDFRQAYTHYKKYAALKDSIFTKDKALQVLRMQMEFENELLEQENQTKEAAVKQRNTLILGVTMALLFALALAYTLNNRRRFQKRINATLNQKNQEIKNQHEEIETQSAELKALNDSLASLNKNLEDRIRDRTALLNVKNKALADYAFFHAHELRAPLTNILGLTDLLKHQKNKQDIEETMQHLFEATSQLDAIIQSIAEKEASEKVDEIKS